MALFITLGLISRPSAKMPSLAQHEIMLSIYQCMLSAVLYKVKYVAWSHSILETANINYGEVAGQLELFLGSRFK